MKSDLDQIIEHLEIEIESLEQSIKESLAEHDYLHAHYQQEGLGRLNNHLDTLKQFKDSDYGKKREIERWIEWLEILNNKNSVSVFEDDIAAKKQELDKLNKNSVRGYFNDTQLIDEALFDLMENRIKGFRFYISKADDFFLDFEIVHDTLQVSHQPDAKFNNYEYLRDIGDNDDEERPYPLESLGFKWDDNSNKLIFIYELKKVREATNIKILLSRIVYEKFSFGSRYNDLQSTIEYSV